MGRLKSGAERYQGGQSHASLPGRGGRSWRAAAAPARDCAAFVQHQRESVALERHDVREVLEAFERSFPSCGRLRPRHVHQTALHAPAALADVRVSPGLIEGDREIAFLGRRDAVIAAAQFVRCRDAEIAEVLGRDRRLGRKRQRRNRRKLPHQAGALGIVGPQLTGGVGSESTTVCWPQPQRAAAASSRHTSEAAPGASARTAKAILAATNRIGLSPRTRKAYPFWTRRVEPPGEGLPSPAR